ncbi:hypothetical protein BX600DRAFT_434167 [Xylariales sp. PMI_506]|nr:hypothetical protein BX600DRAFT_434167 [Xylariales sp. PMI_506]
MNQARSVFVALIRTHHITSRKKVVKLKRAAEQYAVDYVLIRSGGSPGIMFAESRSEASVAAWVAAVQALRYKDYQCALKPTEVPVPAHAASEQQQQQQNCAQRRPGFEEVGSTTEFGIAMDRRGLGQWWRMGMGYKP